MRQKENIILNQNINNNILNNHCNVDKFKKLMSENKNFNNKIKIVKGINNTENKKEKSIKKNNNYKTIDNSLGLFKRINIIDQCNVGTKTRIQSIVPNNLKKKINLKKFCNKTFKKFNKKLNYNNCLFNSNSFIKQKKIEIKNEMKKLFNIKDKELSYEIKYFLDNPKFKYDFDHQNDNNSNIHYINENFIDILLLSFRNKLILNLTIKPLKEIQNEITFAKRSKLIPWLTEINLKYIKDQNILFMAINLLDRILYKKKINIQDFQLIGILCFNLVLKMENIKSLTIEEEI